MISLKQENLAQVNYVEKIHLESHCKSRLSEI